MLTLNNISYKYSNSPSNVLTKLTVTFSKGWTGIIGANGSGKSTLLKVSSGILQPISGVIEGGGNVYYCEQRTDNLPNEYKKFINSYSKQAFKLQNQLGVDVDLFNRWDTLSHGERKKCQLAIAMFNEPEILTIDEPTNHIDAAAKEVVINALKQYRGIGLIVSHDRQLLNELCTSILSLGENKFTLKRGNYDTYEQELHKQSKHLISMKENFKKEIKKLEKEVKVRKQRVTQSDKRVSKRDISAKDHDAKSKIDAARLTGKDSVDNKIYSNLKSRMDRIISEKQDLDSTAKREVGIKLIGSKANKSVLLHKKGIEIKLGDDEVLDFPDLYIKRNDKIGITGNNGCGKSTLVRELVESLSNSKIEYSYIPQEISEAESKKILKDAIKLKHDEKGKIFTIISCLNSDPKRLLESLIPSPGEIRKLMLAYAIVKENVLIIMDEPTNHMDLESIKCIEDALINYNGSLLLVSHDKVFLNNIVADYWRIQKQNNNINTLKIHSK